MLAGPLVDSQRQWLAQKGNLPDHHTVGNSWSQHGLYVHPPQITCKNIATTIWFADSFFAFLQVIKAP